MSILGRIGLSWKLTLLLALSGVAVIASIVAGASLIHGRMIDDRIDKLRAVVMLAVGFADTLQEQVAAHRISQEQALATFRDDLHRVRFGAVDEYLLVQTFDGMVVMHGGNPSLEGKPTASADTSGRSTRDLISDVLRGADGGVIWYAAVKPGNSARQDKLSYVAKFAPWQMVFIAGAWMDDVDAAYRGTLFRLCAIGGLILVVSVLATWLISRDITGSLARLKGAMERLAEGDLATAIPGVDRRDEIGEMSHTVLVFQQHMEREKVAGEQEKEQQRMAVEKHAALVVMVDRIEVETTSAINDVGTQTARMTAAAEEMAASAARTGHSAESAATASAQALENAQTVASAAEELAASISEIGGQVAQSSMIVARAVAAGRETRATIEALNEQVGQIGAVADMIGEIAAKTNLLALNATIEAARAGVAGKGFAVVASEVKALATQTARSTQEIARHIAQVRDATSISVAAVVRIEQTIGEIDAIASSIAAGVEEQGAATAEIARNVTQTATVANEMTGHATEVSTEAEQTGRHAAQVCKDAAGLNTAVGELRQSVIRVVRTSTTEMNRRQAVRHPFDLPCRVSVSGQADCSARTTDISEGGASIRGGPSLHPGARGALHLDGVGFPLPFSVRSADHDKVHLRFELDEATAAKFVPVLQRLSLRRAA